MHGRLCLLSAALRLVCYPLLLPQEASQNPQSPTLKSCEPYKWGPKAVDQRKDKMDVGARNQSIRLRTAAML